jgi:intracellular septation protein
MQTLFDFFIMILFFVFYKLFDIYVATSVAMVASVLQVMIHRIRFKEFNQFQLIFMGIIMVLGSLTLFFQNPWFIKWKPTVVYWVIALILLGSARFSSKSFIEKSMENIVQVPKIIWSRINYSWICFLFLMGFANLYVAYYYDLNTWVNFKLFGTTSCLFLFLLGQIYILNKFQLPNTDTSNSS